MSDASPGYLQLHVRRTSRNLLVWNGMVVALLLALAVWSETYWLNFFRGPLPVDDAWLLAAAARPASGLIAYVELRDRKLIPTGWQEKSTADDRVYEVTPYFFLEVGDKLLLVKTHPERDGNRLIGPLQTFEVTTDVKTRDHLLAQRPELQGKLLPIFLNGAAAFTVGGYLGLVFFVPTFLLCGFNVVRGLWGLNSPAIHPIARVLARYGEPLELAAQIDQQVAAGGVAIGPVMVTSQWVLRPGTFGLIACQLGDIVWGYHLILNGSSLAVICLANGKSFGIPLKRDLVPQLLGAIYNRVPWVRRGYDGPLLTRWRTARQEFIAEVHQDREKFLGHRG